MNRRNPLSVLLACMPLASATALVACSQEHPAASARSAELSLSQFQMGTKLGANGGIAQGAQKSLFSAGDTIHVAVRVQDAPKGTLVRVVWKAPTGETIGEDTSALRPGQEYVHFSADSDNLLTGNGYHAEISANGGNVTVLKFDVS